MTYMFLINYLFSSSVLRRDSFKQFNRIAILALKYSITLHIKSLFAQKHPAKGAIHTSGLLKN